MPRTRCPPESRGGVHGLGLAVENMLCIAAVPSKASTSRTTHAPEGTPLESLSFSGSGGRQIDSPRAL